MIFFAKKIDKRSNWYYSVVKRKPLHDDFE